MTFGPFFEKNFITKLESDPKKWVGDNFSSAFESDKDHGLGVIESFEISPLISEYADKATRSWVYIFPTRKPGACLCTGDSVQGAFSSEKVAFDICERMKKAFESIGIPSLIKIPDWVGERKVKSNYGDTIIHYSITTEELTKLHDSYCKARKIRKENKDKALEFIDNQSIDELMFEQKGTKECVKLLIQSVSLATKLDLPIGFCTMSYLYHGYIEIYLSEKDKGCIKKFEEELGKIVEGVKFYLYSMYDCAM
jgi:hypothetical protein